MVTIGRKACIKALPAVSFVLWCNTFVVIGVYAMIRDESFRTQPCGQSTHLWKYSLFNTVFCFFTCVTFFLFPGGGEGARARALVLTIFHAGFSVWGGLLWVQMTPVCESLLGTHFQSILAFHHICVVHNVVFFTLMIIHESYLGQKFGSDFTLMSEIHQQSPLSAFATPGGVQGFPTPGAQPHHAGAQPPNPMAPPNIGVGGVGGAMQPPPTTGGAPQETLTQDIAKDYENIIKTGGAGSAPHLTTQVP